MILIAVLSLASADFALIVTNNRSLSLGRPDLRYADDDGVQYAKLYGQRFGHDRVTLLTRFDLESQRLHPTWASAEAPTLANLRAHVANLAARVAGAKAIGQRTSVTLIFAGHGDVDRGQGFVELEDGRLSAAMLDREVIAKLPADRVHLLLDSCNSFFMLSPRKAGGTRVRARVEAEAELLNKHPHVGALISTSAEALTYEWSELQSGIFSYLVRSALRGAADVDGDGGVSYREAAAFVDTATRDVVNEQYRPHVLAVAPGGQSSEALLRAGAAKTVLEVAGGRDTRLTVRDRQGVRVLDMHSDGSHATALVLPDDDGPFEVVERQGRAESRKTMLAERRSRLDDLPSADASVAARGEAPVFQALFDSPFNAAAVRDFEERRLREPPPLYGVSKRDTERLGMQLDAHAGFARELRLRNATNMFLGAGLGLSLTSSILAISASYNPAWDLQKTIMATAGGAASLGALIAGVVELGCTTEAERILDEYRRRDLSSEDKRAEAVASTEAQLLALVTKERNARRRLGRFTLVYGIISVGLGLINGGIAVSTPTTPPWMYGTAAATVFLGAGAIITGYLTLNHWRSSSERLWELYANDEPLGAKLPATSLRVQPELMATPGGAQLGLSGSF